jgi:hypothetical protein
MKKIQLIIIVIYTIVPNCLSSQSYDFPSEEGYFSDYELDYYPHFKVGFDCEFQLVFKSVFNSCGLNLVEINQVSGSMMRITGIPPKEWEGKTMVRFLIDDKGIINNILFWGKPISSEIDSCFRSEINKLHMNPALINLIPVKSKFTYFLIE